MPNDGSHQEVIKVLVFFGGKIKDEDAEFLKSYLEKIFTLNSRLNSFIQAFEEIKKDPSEKKVRKFYHELIRKADPEYNNIDNYDDFLAAIYWCENFADFVRTQPVSFQIQFVEYLSSEN